MVRKPGSGGQGLIISEADGRNVAVAYDAEDSPLIAAAPALLAACEAAIDVFDEPDIMDIDEWMEMKKRAVAMLRAAIAKAKREQA